MKTKAFFVLTAACAVLLSSCGSETLTVVDGAKRVNQVVPVVEHAQVGEGQLLLAEVTTVAYEPEFAFEARWIKDFLHAYSHHHLVMVPMDEWQGEKAIQLVKEMADAAGLDESYSVRIQKSGIEISAGMNVGVLYGLQTLVQLLPNAETGMCGAVAWPVVEVFDAPRFQHRGLLLDCCRHFMEPEFVKRTIDHLAFYKMNVLHWHLTEDQGWRIEIKAYPQLTEHGAWRDDGNGGTYGGFYTQEEIKEIVAYAAARGVRVVPEIELPGHSSAALSAYPHLGCTGDSIPVETEWGVFQDVYCAGNDSTVAFLKKVMDEVIGLFPDPYVHIGGDEAPVSRWKECGKCQRRISTMGLGNEHDLQGWLITEIANHLADNGKTIIGWDEILEAGDLPATAVVQSWRGMEGGKQAVEQGHPAIMSPTSHAYFDYPLSSTDLPEVFTFDPIPAGLLPEHEALILGGECNMWTERAPQSVVESKIYPRLLAMSESLWRKDTARSYTQFEQGLEAHYPLMDVMGINYGFPREPVGFEVSKLDGALEVNIVPLFEGVELCRLNALGCDTSAFTGWDTVPVSDTKFEVEFPQMERQVIDAHWRNRSFETPALMQLASHLGVGAEVKVVNDYSPNYTGGGNDALANGILDPTYGDYRSGTWQALQEKNMVVELDLKHEVELSNIEVDFLEYCNAWIFLPDSVGFEVSLDGKSWKSLTTSGFSKFDGVDSDWQKRMVEMPKTSGAAGFLASGQVAQIEPQYKQTFAWDSAGERLVGRYIRMTAYNRGTCPDGHDAAGLPAWLFCDEIVVY